MDSDQIQACIHEGIAKALESQLTVAINTAISASGNGEIKKLQDDMQPIIDAYRTWLSSKRVALVIIGVFITIGAIINTFQLFGGLLSHHLSVK